MQFNQNISKVLVQNVRKEMGHRVNAHACEHR